VTHSRELIIEQIIRDERVLAEPDDFHVPSTAFFEERVAAWRLALARSRSQGAEEQARCQ
jgi:hypothetical protein